MSTASVKVALFAELYKMLNRLGRIVTVQLNVKRASVVEAECCVVGGVGIIAECAKCGKQTDKKSDRKD